MDAAAPYLPKDFADAHFELHERAVSGIPEQQPRWKRAVDATAGAGAGDFGVLGDALGQLYVKKHFPAESRRRMNELVRNLLKTYETSIQELTWMTAAFCLLRGLPVLAEGWRFISGVGQVRRAKRVAQGAM